MSNEAPRATPPSAPIELTIDALDLSRWVRPGDGVVISQCCAEPVPLVDALLAQMDHIGGARVFLGMTFRDAFAQAEGVTVWSYCGLGRTGRIPGLRVVPCHFSALPGLFARRLLPGDVALIQVSPPDERGRCSFGPGADYLADAVQHARVVIAEVNERCPRTRGTSVAWSRLDAVVRTSRPLLEAPAPEPGPVDDVIAQRVARLVHDGDTIQLGVGALPAAIMRALRSHRDLRVHTGMISDDVLDLLEAGVVSQGVVTGAALGSERLFTALQERDDIVFLPVSHTHATSTLSRVGRLVAINSALEIDLDGQAGAESIDGRAIGAVGGQVDFLRGASASGGTGIIALAAQRIVDRLSGPVTTCRADVDWVVTEHGARSLRWLDGAGRRQALTDLGHRVLEEVV